MLATEDYLDALGWAKSVGGYEGLVARSNANLAVIERFVDNLIDRRTKPTLQRCQPLFKFINGNGHP